MRLKRVKIFGFKTFADRTEFDLHGNLVAVVGPNGCGKSNLVDAILWGLGEGNARHLRAQSGQDVIFSGSARRKAVGFAEVNLLFDNEDNALPVQSSEVSITRRLNRAGESDYYINRQQCRLRDVFDLLADSGLGRSGYSIVGQKDIDQALAASAEERRAWVDEAAGVQRYRVRKVESLKRLASGQDHLSRISDILREIEGQREPLREEAELAVRYKSILGGLREVESGLLVVDVAKATAEIAELLERVQRDTRLAREEQALAELADGKGDAANRNLREVEAKLDNVRETRQTNMTAAERSEAAVQLAEQKLKTLGDLEKNLEEEAEILGARTGEAESELRGLVAEAGEESSRLERVQEECAGAGEEAKLIRAQLHESESTLQKAREIHNRKLKQDAELAHRSERKKLLQRELSGIEKSLPDVKAAVDEAQQRHQTSLESAKEAEAAISECLIELEGLNKVREAESLQSRTLLAQRASLDGKRQGIEATVEANEGLNQGARAVLEAKKKGVLDAVYIPVGQALEVRKEHATAIETALGAGVNDLIVQTEADAKTAIEYLKSNRLGRATFQPLPLIRVHQAGPEIKKLLTDPEVVGRACELVGCEEPHKPVFESLLGRILVVKSLNAALRLAKTTGWHRLVTLEGEVVHSGGAVTGGIAAKHAYGLVQRRADLTQVVEDLRALDGLINAAEKKAQELEKRRAGIEQDATARRTARQGILKEESEAKDWLRSVQSELQVTERSAQRVSQELAALTEAAIEDLPEVNLQALEGERDSLLASLAARNADAETAAERLREARERDVQSRTRVETGRKRLAAAEENERIRERRVSNLGPEMDRAAADIERGKVELGKARAAKEAAEAELDRLQAQKAALQADIAACAETARAARAHTQSCTEAAHQAEVSRARADAKRAGVLQRLMEDYSISEEEALIQAPNVEIPSDASTVVNRLRRELKAMGDVNLGAVEAYERLTSRWDELTSQSLDVAEGMKQIEASIKELDKLTRERFLETFAQLQAAFSEIFIQLFGGGEGKLSLTDEENILETGVEIDVLLPGKKHQRLELLSGGERSLCATSFLFALLKVKPSPLVILDEVDAPLDGRNVERFLGLLQEFTAFTQFIVITHNPTTIESAPVWLGVTMDEPGVSTLVPVRFTSVEPTRDMAPT